MVLRKLSVYSVAGNIAPARRTRRMEVGAVGVRKGNDGSSDGESGESSGPIEPEYFGARVKRLREALGMRQSELVRLSGVNASTLSRIESQPERSPDYNTRRALAQALGTTIEALDGIAPLQTQGQGQEQGYEQAQSPASTPVWKLPFGAAIRRRRTLLGQTQLQLSEQLEMSETGVTRLEQRDVPPKNRALIERLAQVLQGTPEQILAGEVPVQFPSRAETLDPSDPQYAGDEYEVLALRSLQSLLGDSVARAEVERAIENWRDMPTPMKRLLLSNFFSLVGGIPSARAEERDDDLGGEDRDNGRRRGLM